MLVFLFYALILVLSLVAFVCWIMEIVAAFQKGDGPLLGILSIVLCSLGGFVIGWAKAKDWGIQKLMIIWTISMIVSAFVWQDLFSGFQEEMQTAQ